jgi:hypothetical protein
MVAPGWHRLSSEALAWHGLNSKNAPMAAWCSLQQDRCCVVKRAGLAVRCWSRGNGPARPRPTTVPTGPRLSATARRRRRHPTTDPTGVGYVWQQASPGDPARAAQGRAAAATPADGLPGGASR